MNDTPGAPAPDEPHLDSSGCLLGCVAQVAVFFAGYALVLWIAPSRLSILSGSGSEATVAALLLVGWLVPVIAAVRILRTPRLSDPQPRKNLLYAWIVASALFAALSFLVMSIRA